ncbi:GntR family transcriptional regulator [Piscinibacter gummiphilus]|uniref:GntR family transcriptional regulator n=1 Tax=Piscinibacter gummiphilus TaxID=946333 RepID=A0ABZ0CWQ2_9BURK|nr:GntR family transcriptional regulator [Piscinibacter gummiphilus]WOB09365.1 GntR family transcriptional regulator [Piscinibacter gummiphilus]
MKAPAAKKTSTAPKAPPANPRDLTRSEIAYRRLKAAIFDFVLLPGDGFTESDMAERLGMSRTPVREALFRLELEGYVKVAFRSGWSVAPFDFRKLEELYDLRVMLECAAVDRLCTQDPMPDLGLLKAIWLVPEKERKTDTTEVASLDEAFHTTLVSAAGNLQMARVHAEVTDGIRIVRRLDFTQPPRVAATYDEHAKILRAILARRADPAKLMLRTHIEASKAEVRKITIHKLHSARPATTDL